MSLSARWLGYRLALALATGWLVLTAVFAFVKFTPDPNVGLVAWSAASSGQNATEAVQAYRASKGTAGPVVPVYLEWMIKTVTLQWGPSLSQAGTPVTAVLRRSLSYTALYVVPAVVLSTLGGLLFGAYGALRHRSVGDRVGTLLAYTAHAFPSFWWYGLLAFAVATPPAVEWVSAPTPPADPETLRRMVFPTLVLTGTILAGQVRYVRSASLEYLDSGFVDLLRAKGSGPLRVGRHVVRNASIPLLSLFFTELLGVLVLEIYVVEAAFGIPGFGDVTLAAVNDRDMPLILGSTLVVAFVGIAANLFQDVAYRVLDPRVED